MIITSFFILNIDTKHRYTLLKDLIACFTTMVTTPRTMNNAQTIRIMKAISSGYCSMRTDNIGTTL